LLAIVLDSETEEIEAGASLPKFDTSVACALSATFLGFKNLGKLGQAHFLQIFLI